MIEFVDTHCHIHESDFAQPLEALDRARQAGVTQLICVGTSEDSSKRAIDFAESHDGVYASIGVHPHDSKEGYEKIAKLASEKSSKLVAIGEIGLDYFYNHSSREVQVQALKDQLQIAVEANLPVIFHVREAFDDFWPIFDSFQYSDGSKIRGVLHSFTDNLENLKKALARGLYIGVNGISTFTRDEPQKEVFRAIPLDRLLLETDAPFLTPVPFRGTINEPKNVVGVAEFYVKNYATNTSLTEVATATTTNAKSLFKL